MTPVDEFMAVARRPVRADEAAVLAAARRVTVAGLLGHRFGGDDGPTVLLVHGWNGGAAQLASWGAPLVAAGFSAVAVDLPAHGASPGDRATIPIIARALADVARALGPIDGIVAHSLGGLAATLVLVDGVAANRAVFLAPVASVSGTLARFARARGVDPGGFRREVEDRVGVPAADLDADGHLARAPALPLLVFHDPADPEVPFADAVSYAAGWPGAVLHAARGRGHRRLLTDAAVIRTAVAHLAGRSDGWWPPVTRGAAGRTASRTSF